MPIDERAALALLADTLPAAGDDAAVVGEHVLTTDMLHETTDFPAGTTRYTAGWRAVGASLSDVAAMGARAIAAVAVYGAPTFEPRELESFVTGAREVCELVGAEYVGGDLDDHEEFTVATTALGETERPVGRDGARIDDVVAVTGTLGRSGAALRLFEQGDTDRANDLFQFPPRVATGQDIAPEATAMMDSSDGLARSLHQLGTASGCGFSIDPDALPIDDTVDAVTDSAADRRELGVFFGEDFELVFTAPADRIDSICARADCQLTVIGRVTDSATGITMDDEPLPDRGYTH